MVKHEEIPEEDIKVDINNKHTVNNREQRIHMRDTT
jgi:hypothetical protein